MTLLLTKKLILQQNEHGNRFTPTELIGHIKYPRSQNQLALQNRVLEAYLQETIRS